MIDDRLVQKMFASEHWVQKKKFCSHFSSDVSESMKIYACFAFMIVIDP